MAGKLRLDFENLPLVEAAVRASFNAPKALTYSLVNSVARELRSFPRLEEAKQLEVAPGAPGTQMEISPTYLPGAVYAGHESGLSVSLQPQVIVTRWVKHLGLQQAEYPRYPALRDSLWAATEAFRKACGDEFPGVAVVNMSYVNFVPSPDTATFLRTYLSAESRLKAMDSAQQVRKIEASWSETDDLDLRFAVEQAIARLPDGATPGFRLTTAAGLRLGESIDAKSALERIHDSLQSFFLKLISEQAKQEWKLRRTPNA
jgi:uncharacterized protein (TIGR04255 family)